MERVSRAEALALAACVAAFCVAMGLREVLNIWIGTGAAALTSALVLWLGARPAVRANLDTPTATNLVVGLVVGVLMSLATWWLYPISVSLFPPIETEVETLYALLRQAPGPVRAFPLLLFVVAAEELVWRGVAIDLFSRSLGPWRAMLVSALLYVLPQVALRSPLLIIVALCCGLLWGALRVQTKGLAAPFVAHLVWDILVFVWHPVA
ncbi:MAG: CPBP family intramembrane metalloprotease [Myxococcales bacterium]|nr:CPBP family intramembrane metalloprotease [Deltaproteobacteria bacterium]NNE18287.1 CPBP family intramembrane metalloprotease [Myxococcales bacterium]